MRINMRSNYENFMANFLCLGQLKKVQLKLKNLNTILRKLIF